MNFEENNNINAIMMASSCAAVEHAKGYRHGKGVGYELDYSEESLQKVEAILNDMHNLTEMLCSPLDPDTLDRSSKMYGGYIGEVLRRAWGEGEWVIPTEGPFAGYITLQYGEAQTSPYIKVAKRLTDGAADNIEAYCHALKDGRNGAVS